MYYWEVKKTIEHCLIDNPPQEYNYIIVGAHPVITLTSEVWDVDLIVEVDDSYKFNYDFVYRTDGERYSDSELNELEAFARNVTQKIAPATAYIEIFDDKLSLHVCLKITCNTKEDIVDHLNDNIFMYEEALVTTVDELKKAGFSIDRFEHSDPRVDRIMSFA